MARPSQIDSRERKLVLLLKAEREKQGIDQQTIIADVRRRVAAVQSAVIFPLIPPAIPGLGVSSGFQMQLELQGGSLQDHARIS